MTNLNYTVKKVSNLINGRVVGEDDKLILGICDIKMGKPSYVSYLHDQKYFKYISNTLSDIIVVDKDFDETQYKNKTFIKVSNPALAFIRIIDLFYPHKSIKPSIHKTSIIDSSAIINKNVFIGPNVIIESNVEIQGNVYIGAGSFIGENSFIGTNSKIKPNVTIYNSTIIKNNVIIDSGTVIGANGFGTIKNNDTHHVMPHVGKVIIEDDVWIGASCCIDRGTINDTVIGSGSKLDNQIQVAHNVHLGKGCLIAAQVAIAGSTNIGDFVTLAGQVGVIGHLNIGDNTVVASKSAVYRSLPPNSFVSGIPARNHSDRLRQETIIKKLPDLVKQINKIIETLNINVANK